MKKLIIAIILGVSMVFTSCDCGCDAEPIECRNPEVTVYKLYYNDHDYNKVVVRKYDTPEAVIIQYKYNDETKNIEIIPKTKETQKTESELESTLNQETYFDY